MDEYILDELSNKIKQENKKIVKKSTKNPRHRNINFIEKLRNFERSGLEAVTKVSVKLSIEQAL